MRKRIVAITLGITFFVGGLAGIQNAPRTLSPCDLAKDRKSLDGNTVRVRGTLSVHFEDFSLEADCRPGIWLSFGGDVPGIVASMANDLVRTPGVNLRVNGVVLPIRKDANFRKLYALITPRHENKPDYRVTATLTGVFFAGGDLPLPGYGHFGCCSLFVITQVEDVDSTPPANLNLLGIVSRPDGKPAQGITIISDVLGGFPPQSQEARTNDRGEFAFSNSGPLVRVENPGFRPVALPVTPGGTPIRITLENSQQSDWIVPACEQGKSVTRIGFGALFVLPPTMESEIVDTRSWTSYLVFPSGSSGPEAVFFISKAGVHGVDRRRIVDSSRSEHRWIKDSRGTVLGIDSRGQSVDGAHWRGTYFAGVDVTYQLRLGQTPAVFDGIIDSACIAKP